MASILKVDTIQDQSGNNIINENADTITIGASGDTVTIPTGASLTVPNGGLSGQNYPAFLAVKTSNQSITSGVATKITFDNEILDTDNAYASDTFTVPTGKGGTYFIGTLIRSTCGSVNHYNYGFCRIYKNGILLIDQVLDLRNNPGIQLSYNNSSIVVLSAGDSLEVRVSILDASGNPSVEGNASNQESKFYGFRIGD
jgi:hypothetical protein